MLITQAMLHWDLEPWIVHLCSFRPTPDSEIRLKQ